MNRTEAVGMRCDSILFYFSDSSETSEDSQYETSAILARRGIQLKGNTNGILDRYEEDGFNSR